MRSLLTMLVCAGAAAAGAPSASAQIAVRAGTLWTMEGDPIELALVLINEEGKITAIGKMAEIPIPQGYQIRECAVATPGLIDVRATVGLTGLYNVEADQDQLDASAVLQPQLRAKDAYNPRDKLVEYVRGFGVTTIHTGHAPGELISGQTMIVKARGATVDEAVLVEEAGVAATLSPIAEKSGGKSPGTRAKMMEMLRAELIKAQAYLEKWKRFESGAENGDGEKKKDPPARDLKLEALAKALDGRLPLIITANRAQDIANAFRLADEFGFTLWLDMAAECYLFTDELKERDVPVLLHPTMYRAVGDTQNLSIGTAKTLADAGVTFAIQTGFEGYVPKVRVALFEAAAAAGWGELGFERALRAVTIDAARILKIDDRVGSIAVGKDGDIAMFDGDPLEYTTHCLGAIIDGVVYPGEQEFEMNYP